MTRCLLLVLTLLAANAQPFDIVVYGGTPGGVATAISAARLGRSVALIEYHKHLGGMTTSGLGKSDIETREAIGGLFRDTAEAETGHAFGHLDFLKEVGDPVTDVAFGRTEQNLKSAVEGETYEYTQMYPGMAKTAREEGFAELAEWFETLAKAEKSHAGRFNKGLQNCAGREPADAV